MISKLRQFLLKHRRYGKFHLKTGNNIPITITREVRYHLSGGHYEIDFYNYNELADFCNKHNCKTITGKTL
jgi:hypothetical protein